MFALEGRGTHALEGQGTHAHTHVLKVMDHVREHFGREFINRIDECITFQPLSHENIACIVQLRAHWKEMGHACTYACAWSNGVRELRRRERACARAEMVLALHSVRAFGACACAHSAAVRLVAPASAAIPQHTCPCASHFERLRRCACQHAWDCTSAYRPCMHGLPARIQIPTYACMGMLHCTCVFHAYMDVRAGP
eukprot:180213-Chlamydomonas_euryale.AAC.2